MMDCMHDTLMTLFSGISVHRRKRQRLEGYRRSNTVEKMIEMVGRGSLSIAAAAEISQCNVADGMVNDAIKAFASLGTNGQNPSNYERDLHRWLKSLFGFELRTYTVTMNLEEPRFPNLGFG